MKLLVIPVGLLVAILPGGCALFENQAPSVAQAPPAAARPARPAARPRPGEPPRAEAATEAPVPSSAPVPAQAAAPVPEGAPMAPGPLAAAAEAPSQAVAAPTIWRVVADRTIGCAVPDTLRLLRNNSALHESQPRIVAQARQEGGCRTAFRVSEWILVRAEGDLVRLRLANPGPGVAPIELFFLRRDVTMSSLPVATG